MAPGRKQIAAEKKTGTSATVLIALAAAVGGFFWWKRKQASNGSAGNVSKKGSRSSFKFPDDQKGMQLGSGMPRNKAGNNKKNKQRKKEERQRRAEKRQEDELPHKKGPGSKGKEGEGDDKPATAVVNYTYFDSARRDGISPIAQKRPKLTAADMMQQQPESREAKPGSSKRG